MGVSKKMMKIAIVLLAIALCTTLAYAVIQIMVTKQMNANFSLKVKYGLGVYQDEACTIPLTEMNFTAGDPLDITKIDCYIRDEGNDNCQISWNSTFSSWSEVDHMYINSNFDFSLSYITDGFHFMNSEHDTNPTLITMTKNQVLKFTFGSKCYTDNPFNTIENVKVFINCDHV